MHGCFETVSIDVDFDDVAVAEFADGASGEGLGRNVADAGTGGHAAEAAISEEGHKAAVRERFEGGGELINLLHACAARTATDEHHHVARCDLAGLDGGDGSRFCGKNARRAPMVEDAFSADEAGVDGGAADDGATRREVAGGKADGEGEAP